MPEPGEGRGRIDARDRPQGAAPHGGYRVSDAASVAPWPAAQPWQPSRDGMAGRGGQSTRMAKKWMEDMGFTWKHIPNMQAHSKADEKHSDMFLPFLAEHATGSKEAPAIQAAKDSLAFNAMYRKGIALAQEKIPG